MTIQITHYALPENGFFSNDDIPEAQYRIYVQGFAEAVRTAVSGAYPEADIQQDIDWLSNEMSSIGVSTGDPVTDAHILRIAVGIFDRQAF